MIKKIPSLIIAAALLSSVTLLPIVQIRAASVSEVMTPPAGWGTPNPTVFAVAVAGGAASAAPNTDTTIALRNAPSTSFNPSLNAQPLATGTDNSVHEIGTFPVISSAKNCPDSTPVTVTLGSSTSTIVAMSGTIPNPQSNNSSRALFDISGPSTPYLSVSNNQNIGDVFTHPVGTYTTTFGNLGNLFVTSNVQIIEGLISDPPNGSQANTSETLPSVTLTYDDTNCVAAIVNTASTGLADTGDNSSATIYFAFALITAGIAGVLLLRIKAQNL